MPLPLGAFIPPLIAWGSRALATYGLARLFSDEPVQELRDMLVGWVLEQAATRAGLQLNPDDPFSDASLAGALSQKTGVTIRSLKDRAMIEEDIDAHAAALVSQRSGYVVRSVRNVEMLKADLQRVACALISEKLGLPAGVMPGDGEELDPVAVKERLLAWAKAELYSNINEQVGVSLQEIAAMGDVEALAVELSGQLRAMGSDEEITARRLAVQISSMMATRAVTEYQQAAQNMSKRSRRQLQLRDAQAKFRARHGNRQVYVPLGMAATVE